MALVGKIKMLLVAVAFFILGVVIAQISNNGNGLLGQLVGPIVSTTSTNSVEKRDAISKYKFISPLLECDSLTPASGKELTRLDASLKQIASSEKRAGHVSDIAVYFRDLDNGSWLGVNEQEPFYPASLLKLPLLMSYYKASESDPTVLTKKIKFERDAVQLPQEVPPDQELVAGQYYTVDEVLNNMIIYSDNDAAFELFKVMPASQMNDTYADLGIRIPDNPKDAVIDARTYSSFLRVLFNSSYLTNILSEKALDLLSQTRFDKGIRAGVDPNVIIAHKFGEHEDDSGAAELHDCGIVYEPGRPYMLCVMSKGSDIKVLESTVKSISKIVYDEMKTPPSQDP